jgi:hypothetical protein
MPNHVCTWYDSNDRSDRRRSLQLWSDGTIYSATRAEPGDVWSPPEIVGLDHDPASARRTAHELGLYHRDD